FFSRFPDWKSICSASGPTLESVLKPLGLVNRRSGKLQELACKMVRQRGIFPSGRKEIMELPSVGQYVASAIELFVYDRPRPLLDVNMARVLDRYFSLGERSDIRHDPRLHALARRLVECSGDPVRVNWAIIDLAATVCLRGKPLCGVCPLKRGCAHAGVTDS
ncbi:hypothetical protein N9089_05610, partial [Crocinitomicaceae bacterium]|nr:hypothetical protein [Crocinitomicaceae bacterium]